MRRKPRGDFFSPPIEMVEQTPIDPSRWASVEEAAIILRKFKRRDGKPSVGAIRNMVYRGQLKAKKFFGRLLFDRTYLNQLVSMAPSPI